MMNKMKLKLMLVLLMSACSTAVFAAKELTDRELRATAESDTAVLKTSIIIQCPKNMEAVECERLKTLRFAGEEQTQQSYDQFLNTQTQNPISNVVKQPLLTQPMQPK